MKPAGGSKSTRVSDQESALIRSQAGPGAGLTALPTGSETTIPSHLFGVVLLRRLRQPLPLSELTIVGCWVAEDSPSRAPQRGSAATHQCRENHGVDDLHGRSGLLTET